jgi:hypothetical protein
MRYLREISTNWFKNPLCLSIRIARLRGMKKAEEQILGKRDGAMNAVF